LLASQREEEKQPARLNFQQGGCWPVPKERSVKQLPKGFSKGGEKAGRVACFKEQGGEKQPFVILLFFSLFLKKQGFFKGTTKGCSFNLKRSKKSLKK
jgi:hypothetical protein